MRLVIVRDLQLAVRRRADVANALLFFVIVASLFPLGVGPEPNLLRAIAPGVIWVAALLATLLAGVSEFLCSRRIVEFVFACCSLNKGPCQAAGGAPG